MPRRWTRGRNLLPFLSYSLAVLSQLFLCRLIIVHQAQIPPQPYDMRTIVEAAAALGMDVLAVAVITLLTLAIAALSTVFATTFMAASAAYLMLCGAMNVGVMRVYHQPATINLVSYGDFVHASGLLSLTRYMTRMDTVAAGAAVLVTASFALFPVVRRWRLFDSALAARILVAVAALALVAVPLFAVLGSGNVTGARNANAGWWLARSIVVPPIGRVAEVSNPDLAEPFETYVTSADREITSPDRIAGANIRNVLIVVLESVGSDYLELDGRSPAAPNLSRLRAEAAYFPNTYAPMPSSPMSLFSLMTSMYPPVSPRAIPMVEPEFPAPTLFEAFKASDRRTAVFSADWGFMDFGRYLKGRVDHLEEVPEGQSCGAQRGEACSFDALKRWVAQSDQPFVAMLWTYRTHYPYGSDPATLAGNPQLAERLYLAGLRQTDSEVGELMSWLREQGRLDQTLVVIVGDHGEAFMQHGTLSHGNDVYRETVRVPLMLVNRRLFSGVTDPTPVRMIDVGPTLLSLAGATAPVTFQGLDLSKPLRPRRVFFSAAWLNLVMGYQEGRMKYDYAYVPDRLQAFDVERDSHERVDLGRRLSPSERAKVIRRIMNWKAAIEAKAQAVRSSAKGR